MADIQMPLFCDLTALSPPETLDPTIIPPVWRSITPGGYCTPPYTLGWRLTPQQLQAYLDPDGTKTTIPVDFEACCIGPRWSAFGYEEKYCDAQPEVATMPARDGARAYDLIVYITSNASKATLEVVQGADIQEIIAAAVHTLNLPDDLVSDLKWHAHLPRQSKRKTN
ncbi:hypothetical protein AB1N83_010474 [Pleurotus pulmonarius]